ncbi:bifunctional tryptophan synthase trp1 [Naganishia vaughanmartiniae]|uniref:Bifunctional tryptophan synthase trp1 n=1 Tax=Naganishia vaughanmartiniae TaxID=1424756 RepID=A0ACC2XQX7_9TREE|nr:bifunctional tryptophan synthase trp1 [Naganishia vaughanmartiniae]
MAEHIKRVFAAKKAEGEPAFVTFVTAGYPRPEDTVPNMLALEAGGADIIELGVPFSDPTADGPTIQAANTYVREARAQGLKAPVMLMGQSSPPEEKPM